MGSRYLVSGAQIGMLKAALRCNDKGLSETCNDLIEKILNDQCIGRSTEDVMRDVDLMDKSLFEHINTF